MQFVDEDDGILVLHQLLHDRLEALFELPAVLGPGDDQGQIQRQDALVRKKRQHHAAGDALRQTLDDGGLAHARLADEHGVVLGPAAQDLHHALEFVLAPHERIELSIARLLGQVATELGQHGAFLGPIRQQLL